MVKQTEERKDIGQTGAASIRPRLKVQIAGTEPFFGPGVRMLLLHIRTEGSVREACEKMGLSYSKGRKLLDRAERELGYHTRPYEETLRDEAKWLMEEGFCKSYGESGRNVVFSQS